jgi:chromosome segregation ATPase
LEAQRLYLEQVNETLNQAKSEKENLMETKGSLETQLRLEASHKEAVNNSLQQQVDEAERRNKELEDRLLRDRDSHKDQIDEVRRSVSDELKQGAERLAAVEAELLTARQRCELLARNKADLLQEVAENNSRFANVEATISEHRNKSEELGFELEQIKTGKDALDQELKTLREEKRQCEHRIDELINEVKSGKEAAQNQEEDHKLKFQRLDDLLNQERKLREDFERSLGDARHAGEKGSQESMNLRRKLEQDLLEAKSEGESWREKAEDTIAKLQSAKEQLDAQKTRADEVDTQRREVESQLRGDLATAEARLRRLEQEAQRATTAVEDGKAAMAEQSATMNAKISALERQVTEFTKEAKTAQAAKEAAEGKLLDQSAGSKEQFERLGMASEELMTRQVLFALEKQRLSGALEESRRTLRNSLAVPTSTTAIDTVRITGLEQQLAEERRKSIEQAVALQRAERKCTQLEDANKRSEEHRSTAVANARDAERRTVSLSEELRKSQLDRTKADQQFNEVRERGAMSKAEIYTVKYNSTLDTARMRGINQELRLMMTRGAEQARKA